MAVGRPKLKNTDITGLTSGSTDLDGLTDVAISSPIDDQYLRYNGTVWVNETVSSSSVNLDGLTDVVIASPTDDQYLRYDGTNWVNETVAPTSTNLDGLTDVVISSPATDQVLTYNGTNWVNATPTAPALPAPIVILGISFPTSNGVSLTNQPSTLREFPTGNNSERTKADLTNATQIRIVARINTAGATAAELRPQYSTNSGSTWNYFNAAGSTPGVSLVAAGLASSAWATMDSGAKADVWVRVIEINGDGASDPIIGHVQVQVK